jgi:hypothetical protein
MNNQNSLRVINNETCIQSSQSSFTQALINGKPINQFPENEKLNLIMGNILNAVFTGGWATKADADIQLMAGSLLIDIDGRFQLMTDIEIREAFIAGAKGNYGENKGGLSVVACVGWLSSYCLDSSRAKAKKEIEAKKQIEENNKMRPIPGLNDNDKKIAIQSAYDKYLKQGTYHDYGNLIYDLLDKSGMIPFTNAEKRAFLEKGRKVIYDRLQNWRDMQEKRENEKKLEELMESDKTAIIEAKRLALLDYFERLKKSGVEVIQLLKAA